MQLDHIALIISAEENLEFYKNLGFVEFNRIKREYDLVVFMRCGETILEVFVDDRHPERLKAPEGKGLRHIAFTVDSFDTIAVEKIEIKDDWYGRKRMLCTDPDGQPIELIEKVVKNH